MKLGYTIYFVPNVIKAVEFYERAFGLERNFIHESNQFAEMKTGETAPISEQEFVHKVVPDHCTDLIFDLGDACFSGFGTGRTKVVGVMTKAIESIIVPKTCLLGVRFKPYGAVNVFRVAARELLDQQVDLVDLDSSNFDIREQLLEVGDTDEKLEFLDRYFLSKLSSFKPIHKQAQKAVRLIESSKGGISVSILAETLGTSRRHLHRVFLENIGLTPKQFLQVTRFRSLIPIINKALIKPDWSNLALDLGFYDQAHFINDFKAIMGVSPNYYWQHNLKSDADSLRELAKIS